MQTQNYEPWPRCPKAAFFFETLWNEYSTENPFIADMAAKFHKHSGIHMSTLVDHWILTPNLVQQENLTRFGFLPEAETVLSASSDFSPISYYHPGARLPRVRFGHTEAPYPAIQVEDLDLFLKIHKITPLEIEGEHDSCYREALCSLPDGFLKVISRKGYTGYHPGKLTHNEKTALAEARYKLRTRSRGEEAHSDTLILVSEMVQSLGHGRATDEFFAAEREYYMTRNEAASWLYGRQQDWGLGWSNHDHHTYRSSRIGFLPLLHIFKALGFQFRERFYAGEEAGWGAQVLEHPASRVVIFADVDLSPEELSIDFKETALPDREQLGTIGLWCALHTDSIAAAGMHHLEAEYDWRKAHDILEASGHPVMKPFTDLPMLKQAFTKAEPWKVESARLDALLTAGAITREQADLFRSEGAAGSHLEILQRWEGYKGFNQTGVSSIIRETDARLAAIGVGSNE